MPLTDIQLANQSGAEFREELNEILLALAGASIGDTAPAYARPGLLWIDTDATPWIKKRYDGADWIVEGRYDPAANLFRPVGAAANELLGLPTVQQLQNSSVLYKATTGSDGAYVLDFGLGLRPAAYVEGMEFRVKWNHANPGAATINITGSAGTGLGAKNVKNLSGEDPGSGELPSGGQTTIRYDGTDFIVLNSVAASSGIPVGCMVHVPFNDPPEGLLALDGTTGLLRADFPKLYSALNDSGRIKTEGTKLAHEFGNGNGTTTFSLADLRGDFIRCWDDGRGVDVGRAIWSWQNYAIQSHNHTWSAGGSSGAGNAGALWGNQSQSNSTGSTGGAETRPRNTAALLCIKY